MSDNVKTLHIESPSKIQKIKEFARKYKMPLALTATAVTAGTLGYKLRDNSDQILNETAELLSDTAEKLDNVADTVAEKTES